MSSKRCFKCGEIKSLSDFYRHAQMKDGHLNKCIQCTKSDVAKHRIENINDIRQYERMRASMPHRVEKNKEYGKVWRLTHPDRKKAQTALRGALLKGAITPLPCLICGDKAEAHHPDYSRPLDVVWLCPSHHRQTHALTMCN